VARWDVEDETAALAAAATAAVRARVMGPTAAFDAGSFVEAGFDMIDSSRLSRREV
jgi:hypothetical protein